MPNSDNQSLDDFVTELRQTVATLWYPSEIDAPVEVVVWPVAAMDEATLRQQTGTADSITVQPQPPDRFFCQIVDNPFWHTAQGGYLAQHYGHLQNLLNQHLSHLQSYRVGQVEGQVYLLGCHGSGIWVGLYSTWVET